MTISRAEAERVASAHVKAVAEELLAQAQSARALASRGDGSPGYWAAVARDLESRLAGHCASYPRLLAFGESVR